MHLYLWRKLRKIYKGLIYLQSKGRFDQSIAWILWRLVLSTKDLIKIKIFTHVFCKIFIYQRHVGIPIYFYSSCCYSHRLQCCHWSSGIFDGTAAALLVAEEIFVCNISQVVISNRTVCVCQFVSKYTHDK